MTFSFTTELENDDVIAQEEAVAGLYPLVIRGTAVNFVGSSCKEKFECCSQRALVVAICVWHRLTSFKW